MAELKTQKTGASVDAFLDKIEDETKREDTKKVAAWMSEATGAPAKMWGTAIVGFGERRLKYDSGRELDWMIVGLSPRKDSLTLYLPGGLERLQPLLDRLGKYKTGKGCLYVKKLSEVDEAVLREIIATSLKNVEA